VQLTDDTALGTTRRIVGFSDWRDLLCNRIAGVDVETRERSSNLVGTFSEINAGGVRVDRIEVRADPYLVRRRTPRTDLEKGPIFVLVMIHGVSVIRQDDREAVLQSGDFAVYDSARPYQVVFPHGDQIHIALRLPRALLGRLSTRINHLTAVPTSGTSGMGIAVSPLLMALDRALPSLPGHISEELVKHTVQLLLMALDPAPAADEALSWGQSGHMRRVRQFIDRHADDERLSPADVAHGVNLSLGHLHRLFRGTGATLRQTILETRLERCREDLTDLHCRDSTITEIAFRHGFRDPAHFTRAFQRRYGSTPSQWRSRHRT
jgi:AraC-like DNA-binding protein